MISGKKSGFKMWIQSAPSILELPGNTAFPPKKNLGCLLACLMPLPARIGQLTSTVPLALAVCMSGRPAEPGWTASKKGVWAAQLPAPLPSPSVPLHSRDQSIPLRVTPTRPRVRGPRAGRVGTAGWPRRTEWSRAGGI